MNNLPEVKQEGFVESYQSLYRLAELFSKSGMIPAQYKNNAADCMIALNMAQRSGMEPVFVMQNMYVVKGHPSWSGQACIPSCPLHQRTTFLLPFSVFFVLLCK